MTQEYKKGYLEAIDGVLEILNDSGQELDKENRAFKYELKKLENSVLGLKVDFFETYYQSNSLAEIFTPEQIQKAADEAERRYNADRKGKGRDLTEEEAIEEDEDVSIVISKEDIFKYCEKHGLTLEQFKEKLENLIKEFPPRIMTEEQFDNESRRAQEKNPIAD